MKTILHRSNERGKGDYGWLQTSYSFSFANWYNPEKMGFGTLRVINDDIIAPQSGFGTHGHKNMEIITIVMRGTVSHKDSMGNSYGVHAGEVQVMSAGTGVMHSEYNESATESLELFQIWIEPKVMNVTPRYEQKVFSFHELHDDLISLVGPHALHINQDAKIFYGALDADTTITYKLEDAMSGVYIFVIEGSLGVANEILGVRDAIGLSEISSELHIEAREDVKFLIIEVKM